MIGNKEVKITWFNDCGYHKSKETHKLLELHEFSTGYKFQCMKINFVSIY
jgi:hypothetical protein